MQTTEEDKKGFFEWHEGLRKRAKEPATFKKWYDYTYANAGIRMYPGWGNWSEIRLLLYFKRYSEAGRLLQGSKCVLDFGCGSGYGSEILAKFASGVIGYDVDERAIDYARDFHAKAGVTFVKEMPAVSFDGIVAIESIEHVEDVPKTINYFKTILIPNGKLIMSTPNMVLSNIGGFKTRLLLDQFKELLEKDFDLEVLTSNPTDWKKSEPLSWYFIGTKK